MLKSDFPKPSLEQLGYRFFRPDQDDSDDHFRVNPLDRLRIQGTTAQVGEYTEKMLRLNRDALIRLRKIRDDFEESAAMLVHGTRVLRGLHPQDLPKESRHIYQARRDRLLKLGHHIGERLNDVMIKELNRSDLLDRDPKPADAEERRQYLRRLKATVPPPPTTGKTARSSAAKRRKRKSRR
jgi:hypothetical protein